MRDKYEEPQPGMPSHKWQDPATGVEWRDADNDTDVTWEQAMDYCAKLSDEPYGIAWTLPEIDDVA